MSHDVHIRREGDKVILELPADMVGRLPFAEGDSLSVVEVRHGLLLTASDPQLKSALADFEEIFSRYESTFRALAQ